MSGNNSFAYFFAEAENSPHYWKELHDLQAEEIERLKELLREGVRSDITFLEYEEWCERTREALK